MTKRNKLVAGLVMGAAVGAAAGLLLAPKPGKEARQVVASRLGNFRHKAGSQVRTLRRKRPEERQAATVKDASDQRVGIPG
jgi:gas vesicle protein